MTPIRYHKGKHPLDVYRDRGGTDPAVKKYLNAFRVSDCPGCGRVQYTPRGEAVGCPKCVAGKESIARTSVPMRMKDRQEGGR